MPSIGLANVLSVSRKINAGINKEFPDEEFRGDANTFLKLSSDGANFKIALLKTAIGIMLSGLLSFYFGPIAILIGIFFYWWIQREIKSVCKAREDLKLLVSSNIDYWSVIAKKIKQIVINSGAVDDGFYPSQIIRAWRREKVST
jgi:hypothetical protein